MIILANIYAWVVVFVLPINGALNPIIYTLAAPTEIRRRIYKWTQQIVRRIEFTLISESKSDQRSCSMISHTSVTGTTEARSSNGSAVSLPLTLHSTHNCFNSKVYQHIKNNKM